MSTSIAHPEPKKVLARTAQCMQLLMEAGLSFDDLQTPINDPEMRRRLVRFWMDGSYMVTTTQKLAREIMGKNFLGIEEAIQHFGVNFSEHELQALAEISFSEAVLRECKDTHVLVCVPALSILDIRIKRQLFHNNHDDAWYNRQRFAKDKWQVGWYLISQTAVSDSKSKNWNEQKALLQDFEIIPSARIMIYTIISHFLATGKRLFEKGYIRTSSVASCDCISHVVVGYFGSQGLNINDCYWNKHCYNDLGLASARKPK